MEKYKLLPPCRCKLNCFETFDEGCRQDILKLYWSKNFGERRQWLDSYIKLSDVGRRTNNGMDLEFKRKRTLLYSLPEMDGTCKHVCKKMFMATLGLKSDGIITEFVSTKTSTAAGAITPTSDGRGKSTPNNKKDKDVIRHHINSHHPVSSHYTRENAPNRRYLEPHLSIKGEKVRSFVPQKMSLEKIPQILLYSIFFSLTV